ncbi:MAG: GNAT family N-acetyltransferase [Muribaculum sp.]|nr:GNAT family N-acetyltransferase [Muribaculum sp.]
MNIEEIHRDKKRFLSLLLLGDEQEDMIDRYLNNSQMFILSDGVKAIGECVVQDMCNGIVEIKNIAVISECQGKGYGRMLIDFVESKFSKTHSVLQVGTGDSPLTIPFYEKCGFMRSHVVKNFFTDNYDHPIYENGIQLIDMIYLQKEI